MSSAERTIRAIVVNLNGGDLVAEALESLLAQEGVDLRVTVVDNGSTDGSPDALRRRFREVELIEAGQNLGFCGANNLGMSRALERGEGFVFLLNYDARVGPRCLATLADRARHSGAGMVGPKILYDHDPSLIWSAGGTISWWRGAVSHRGIRHRDDGRFDRLEEVDYLTACAVLIDCAVLRTVGFFDERYWPSYFEDTDLCVRARRAGFRLLYEPAAVAWHKVSSFSGGGTTPLKVTLRLRNQYLFFRRWARWYHWPTIIACGSGTVAWLAVRWLVGRRWGLLRGLGRGVDAMVRGDQRSPPNVPGTSFRD